MLDPRWLSVLALLDVWALSADHALLGLTCTFSLMCAAAVTLWQRHGLRGVSYRRELGRERAQQGEVVSFSATFCNHKLLPLSLLEVYDTLPRHVTLTGGAQRESQAGLPCLYIARAMPGFARITRHVQVRCVRRGVQQFGPVRYQTSDFLGLTEQHGGDDAVHELLVLPKVFALDLGPQTARQMIGARSAPQQLLADPLRKLGVREYRAGDPQRAVDWRATARRSSLMVREVEPSATPALQIILNFQIRTPEADRVEPDELEYAISVAASVAAYASQHGMAVGLCGNGSSAGKPLALPASRAPQQVARVLELLARATSRPTGSLAAWLRQRQPSLQQSSTWLVISEYLDAEEQLLLRDAARRGHSVVVLLTCAPHKLPKLHASLRHLHMPYQEGWSQRDALTFAA